jgi:hypothetical protein
MLWFLVTRAYTVGLHGHGLRSILTKKAAAYFAKHQR